MTEVHAVEEIGQDVLLTVLAGSLQEARDFEIGLTVTVAGGVVSGLAIGRDRWLSKFASVTREAQPGAETSLGEAFEAAIHQIDLERPAEEEVSFGFLHMVDARFISGAGMSPSSGSPGFLWRGRLTHVTSWSLGQLR